MLHRRRRGGALAVYDLQRLIVANEEGRLVQLSRAEEVLGHIIVQEAMVLVNTLAAKFMVEHDVPGLYRNHVPRPASPPVRDLAETLEAWIKSGELDLASARAQFHAIVGRASYGATTLGHISWPRRSTRMCRRPCADMLTWRTCASSARISNARQAHGCKRTSLAWPLTSTTR